MDDSAQSSSSTQATPADSVQPAVSPADDLAQLTKDPLPSFVDEIKQFEEQHPQPVEQDNPDYQVMYNQGGKFKEQLEAMAGSYKVSEQPSVPEKRVTEFTEIPANPELEKQEMAGYIEKIEKEAELASPVTDDYNNVLLAPTAPQNPTITLPMTEDQIQQGLHHKVFEAVRWMAEWCVRQAKKMHGGVQYKQ